jgi:hypothetical protein
VCSSDLFRYTPFVNGEPIGHLPKSAAVKYLLIRQGLGESDMQEMVKEAETYKRTAPYFVKYAFGEPPASAIFPEPQYGVEAAIPAQITYPQTMAQNLGQNDNASSREQYINRWDDDANQPWRQTGDADARRSALTAARLGQKEVFDVSSVARLVHMTDADSLVDSYLGDLLLAVDRIGRILFLYYWHHDKFSDRYGQQDMLDLEDSLKSTFKSLGELVLFLKQKTIETQQTSNPEATLTHSMLRG